MRCYGRDNELTADAAARFFAPTARPPRAGPSVWPLPGNRWRPLLMTSYRTKTTRFLHNFCKKMKFYRTLSLTLYRTVEICNAARHGCVYVCRYGCGVLLYAAYRALCRPRPRWLRRCARAVELRLPDFDHRARIVDDADADGLARDRERTFTAVAVVNRARLSLVPATLARDHG